MVLDDMTDDPVVTIIVETPIGPLVFTAEPIMVGQTLVLERVHVQGAQPNTVGIGNLGMIARVLIEGWATMDSSFRERFGQLGPIQAIDRVTSGSPAVFVLRLLPGQAPRTISGMLALARRGLTMLRAKRAIEALVEQGRIFVDLPMVERAATLIEELAEAGIASAIVEVPQAMDVRGLRERLGLTPEQFAMRYGLEVETLRNWEIGKRDPDTTARSYLRAIASDPERVERAYAPTPIGAA